ncbi:MAG: Gfo/Idh/MocA family oxidoreductase [Mycetocola sp.]
MTTNSEAIRIGILGAARITKAALLTPAAEISGVEVVSIAARDSERARAYADEHAIGRTHSSYETLLADDSIDAVYIPLPAALHGRWATAALQAGKHVLLEKPFTANASEAQQVAAVADSSGRVLMEAYHSGYHPLQARLRDIVTSGMLGDIQTARATFCVPIPPGKDIRWNLSLGGGGLLDVGYYPVRVLREIFGSAPDVTGAQARQRGGVDRLMRAGLRFDGGVRAEIVSSLWSRHLLSSYVTVVGSRGRLRVSSPYHPQFGSVLRIVSDGNRTIERPTRRATYTYQLEAFRDAVRSGAPVPTGPAEAVAQMKTLDAIYTASGMAVREPLA